MSPCPTWGPFPWVTTTRCPSRTMAATPSRDALSPSISSSMEAGRPGRMTEWPPRATRTPAGSTASPLRLPDEGVERVLQAQRPDLLHLVADAAGGLADLHDAAQVDGRGDDDRVALHGPDGLLELVDLRGPVAHGGEEVADVVVLREGAADGPHGEGARVHELGGPGAPGGEHARAEGHPPVGEGGPVLDDERSEERRVGKEWR